MEKTEQILLRLMVESWRFSGVFDKALALLDAPMQKKFSGRVLWYRKQLNDALEQAGYQMPAYAGTAYDPGLPLTPLNADEFAAEDCLVVDYMIDPVLLDREGNVVQYGTAMLRRAEA